MHEEVLTKKQIDLLVLINEFSSGFGLIGGTAIALQLGHRRSIDFDLATLDELDSVSIRDKIRKRYSIETTLVDEANELSVVVNSVKLTFIKYPFTIDFDLGYKKLITIPNILTLSAMKAYALGRRAKWKDYVDLYFVFKQHSISDLTAKAREIFGNEFNEKLFREQLSYFQDIDYSEQINYIEGFETDDKVIKQRLEEISLQK